MALIFGLFGGSKFPNTQKYESSQMALKEDLVRFNEFEDSPLFKRYLELDNLVHTGEFEKRVNELKRKRFKDTEQYRQLKQYVSLKKSGDIKTYLSFSKSGKAEKLEKILNSESYKKFQELEAYINSPEFYKEKAHAEFKSSEAYTRWQGYKDLKKNGDIKMAQSTLKSSAYKTYTHLTGTPRIQNFFDLEAVIESQEFRDFKHYMEDKNRFKNSEEARTLKEFNELKKNQDILWFLKTKKEQPFETLKQWELTFEEDFDAPQLNKDTWMTGYYWGKTLMNDSYVLEGEHQFYRDKNIELRNSCARITTQKEKVEGKVWSPQWGFRTAPFDYTSGLISTGQSFRQQYGRFEAKVRFNQAFPLTHAFWMTGEQKTPHIDVFKTLSPKGNKIEPGLFATTPKKEITRKTTQVKGAKFLDHFFIYTLEWTPEKLIWKINGVEVHRETQNVPQEPMYMTFCTTLPQEPKEGQLPSVLEIDWVRCYQHKTK